MQRGEGCEPVPEKMLLLMHSVLEQFNAPVLLFVDRVHSAESPMCAQPTSIRRAHDSG
jgi:hypothetical protein